MHLILIEDDLQLGAELQRALGALGLTSEWVRGAKAARALVKSATEDGRAFACALLDLGLPDGEGLELLKQWRSAGLSLPVIVLTARDALATRIEALDAGADDYVIKPCATAEIASRIRAVARRAAGQSSSVWSVGALRIDTGRHEVSVDGEPVALSPKEFLLVQELARRPGETIPRHRLARALAPLAEPVALGALEFHVHNLRRKLGGERIRTVRGVGYGLEAVP